MPPIFSALPRCLLELPCAWRIIMKFVWFVLYVTKQEVNLAPELCTPIKGNRNPRSDYLCNQETDMSN